MAKSRKSQKSRKLNKSRKSKVYRRKTFRKLGGMTATPNSPSTTTGANPSPVRENNPDKLEPSGSMYSYINSEETSLPITLSPIDQLLRHSHKIFQIKDVDPQSTAKKVAAAELILHSPEGRFFGLLNSSNISSCNYDEVCEFQKAILYSILMAEFERIGYANTRLYSKLRDKFQKHSMASSKFKEFELLITGIKEKVKTALMNNPTSDGAIAAAKEILNNYQ